MTMAQKLEYGFPKFLLAQNPNKAYRNRWENINIGQPGGAPRDHAE
jgi:hypothetical protein